MIPPDRIHSIELIRRTVREIVDRYDSRYWFRKDEEREFPLEFIEDLERHGVMGVNIPEDYGGAGFGLLESAAVLEEIASSPGGTAASNAVHAAIFNTHILVRYGTGLAKERYLPEIARGNARFLVYAVTEPHSGFNTPRIKTQAKKDGDYYIINGQKVFISRLKHSDLGIIAARTTPYEKAAKKTLGITLFLVDLRHAKGRSIKFEEIPNNLRRFIDTNIVYIEDLAVPAENVIGDVDRGFYILMEESNVERTLMAAQCVASGRWVIKRAVQYANNRIVFPPDPISKYQGIQYPLADAWIRLEAGDLLKWKALEILESGEDRKLAGYYANIAKYIACEACYQAARMAMWTMGGYGYSADMDVERHWRSAELQAGVGQISPHMILNYVANKVLGMPRSYGE